MEWKPIETAPKDGEIILWNGRVRALGRWMNAEDAARMGLPGGCWFPLLDAVMWHICPDPPDAARMLPAPPQD